MGELCCRRSNVNLGVTALSTIEIAMLIVRPFVLFMSKIIFHVASGIKGEPIPLELCYRRIQLATNSGIGEFSYRRIVDFSYQRIPFRTHN